MHHGRGDRGASAPTTRTRARCSPRRGGSSSRPSRDAAPCCSRTSAPRSRPLPDLLTGIAAIAATRQVDIPVVAHAGDGNTHPTIVFDPADAAARERAALAFTEIMALAISLGGTITGEHGIGRLKKELLPTQLGRSGDGPAPPDQAACSTRDGILNPGAILDPLLELLAHRACSADACS